MKAECKHMENNDKPRKAYSAPKLVNLGGVAEVTLAGSGGRIENDCCKASDN